MPGEWEWSGSCVGPPPKPGISIRGGAAMASSTSGDGGSGGASGGGGDPGSGDGAEGGDSDGTGDSDSDGGGEGTKGDGELVYLYSVGHGVPIFVNTSTGRAQVGSGVKDGQQEVFENAIYTAGGIWLTAVTSVVVVAAVGEAGGVALAATAIRAGGRIARDPRTIDFLANLRPGYHDARHYVRNAEPIGRSRAAHIGYATGAIVGMIHNAFESARNLSP